ncbi:MAG TPA: YetF domain-containing protein [Anaerolineaceae bacterium]
MENLLARWIAAVFSSPDLMGAFVIAGKTAVVYLFVVAGLRLLGKRELGQMSIYDLTLIIIIANSVQNAMVGQDNTLVGGIVAALTLLILNRIFTWALIRQPKIRTWLLGQPVLIVRGGRYLDGPMEKEGLTRDHVEAAMREHGIAKIDDVQMAVLEVDGTISIVQQEAKIQRTRHRFRGLRVS